MCRFMEIHASGFMHGLKGLAIDILSPDVETVLSEIQWDLKDNGKAGTYYWNYGARWFLPR